MLLQVIRGNSVVMLEVCSCLLAASSVLMGTRANLPLPTQALERIGGDRDR